MESPWVTTLTVLLTLLLTLTSCATQTADIINTTLGPIQGLRKTVKGRDVDVYYGIPFAKPPVGDLRFKHPVPAVPWTEVKMTDTKPNSCHQSEDVAFNKFRGVDMWNPNTPVSEDCLYINLWVPRGAGSPPRATMVWIFGGGFWAGTSTLDVYDGSNLASTENVVVASMNYRLGALGFLYTGTEEAPGNQGLLDQVLALRWVHENVVNFGATPETITIFGESAGAVSVGFHLMSPLSMNFFSRAIMQSSSPTVNWGVFPEAKATLRTRNLASIMGCPSSPADAMTECMRRVNAQNLTDSMWSVTSQYFDMPLGPVVDDYFLMDEPMELLKRGEVKDTQVIVGANKDEGMYWLIYGFAQQFPLNNSGSMSRADFETVARRINFVGDDKQTDALIYEYYDGVVPTLRDSYRDVADDMSGDDLFICPVVSFAALYAGLRPSHSVYMYSFEHRLSNNPWPAWMGVLHGYEIEAMFALPLPANYTPGEEALASRITGYWTRFAQFGDPNANNETWPNMTTRGLEYLKMTAKGDTIHQGLRHRQCSFRKRILPLLEQDPTTNQLACQTSGNTDRAQASHLILYPTVISILLLLNT
ncbi:acetylcholinesterase-like isoform X2 [Littorina saxatilis]